MGDMEERDAIVYNVGDKAVITSERKAPGRVVHLTEDMKEWIGKVVTISEVNWWHKKPYYHVKENDWIWDNSLLDMPLDFCLNDDSEIANASFGKFFSGYAVKAE